jgi:hypothetical protein
LKIDKLQINSKPMNDKTILFTVPNINITSAAFDNHMVVIQVQMGINAIDDVLLGSYRIDNPFFGVTGVVFMGVSLSLV